MCTVTYLPLANNNFILTSSRDIPFAREKALFPKKYVEDTVALTYPKDGKAGGTWIGYSSKNRLICLLNGGFKNHYLGLNETEIANLKYRKSRGIIVKDLLKSATIEKALSDINLQDIEPFTLVIADWNATLQLLEFVWTGTKKYLKKLPQQAFIWSSSPLYNEATKNLRKDWFATWQKENAFTSKNILGFHHTAGIGNLKTDVLMQRKKGGTVSITQVLKKGNGIVMDYEEII